MKLRLAMVLAAACFVACSSGKGQQPSGLTGREQVIAIVTVPVTGPVRILRPTGTLVTTVQSQHGNFTVRLAPGRYQVQGYAGDAICAPVSVTVQRGQFAPVTVSCQGD